MAADQAFADHVGGVMDMWAAAILFVAYTVTAALIFIINKARYG